MSLLTPKTIVITTVPGKTQSRPITVQAPMDVDYYSEDQDGGPRKRRRLTHLSPEEKMMRRKLKNRVAAQTARDRKKALMTDLEIQVAKLMEENKRLQRENSNLKQRSSALLTENSSLKERLETDGSLVKLEEGTSGSAVSSVSLPRGHTPSSSLPVMPYVLTLCLYLAMYTKVQVPPSKLQTMMSNLYASSKLSPEEIHNLDPILQWWGRHQQNWNPSMN